jgi:hypothetical protein
MPPHAACSKAMVVPVNALFAGFNFQLPANGESAAQTAAAVTRTKSRTREACLASVNGRSVKQRPVVLLAQAVAMFSTLLK